jgi:4'-phosphopantetheinyl transferase
MTTGTLDAPRAWAQDAPAPAAEDVHVWRVNVDAFAAAPAWMHGVLSPEESARAARFGFERDRRRFVVRHAALRLLLGRYLDADPAALCFTYGPQGKPALERGGALSFSMSHSNGLALVALARGREVGVDVEWCARGIDALDIARQFFSEREADALAALGPSQRRSAFFRLWTRKEALLKATGLGLSVPLREVEALPAPSTCDPAARWSCVQFAPADGYAAAVAAAGDGWRLTQLDGLPDLLHDAP